MRLVRGDVDRRELSFVIAVILFRITQRPDRRYRTFRCTSCGRFFDDFGVKLMTRLHMMRLRGAPLELLRTARMLARIGHLVGVTTIVHGEIVPPVKRFTASGIGARVFAGCRGAA